ncbi:hypothetical protein DPMN_186304 [Dreissena polymorpha]|uniref:Uncharacterized protein n=1 Tax=Dreissena polymorpha TaxID=45954 RepID=A0A9D4I828_DREPO|nr:hypothetical protein DPMN_186304 [Dreissena polymorpha]
MLNNMKHMTTTEDAYVAKESKLQAEIRDRKCQSMLDNLLLSRIQEEQYKNCENKILDFIVTQLHIQNAPDDITIHRASSTSNRITVRVPYKLSLGIWNLLQRVVPTNLRYFWLNMTFLYLRDDYLRY